MNNAKWIYTRNPESFESGTAENVNPWESRITVEMQKSPLEPESGLSIFRKKFTVTNDITDCEITATSLGNFDLYCNGKRVGSTENGKTVYDEMKPGWSDFDKRALSYTYSLKDYLVKGENSILAVVSNGWWAGRIAVWTYKATDTAFIAKLTFDNGTTIETDESWESYFGGRIRYADIWDGEYYDSTYESFEKMSISDTVIENPSKTLIFTSFQGVITPHFGPTIRVREHLSRVPETVTLYEGSIENDSDFGKINIIPTSYKFKEKQTMLFDYGQNMVGIPYIKIRGKKGTRVDIIFGEMLNDSGKKSRGNDGPEGSIYSANYRSAKAKCTYIMNGDEDFEEFRPLLTFYGFRYMEISVSSEVELSEVKALCVGSDIKETGTLETSNDEINQLISNIIWGQRGNYFSVPTDCPQRDERLGWTGDTQLFAPTAAYNANVLEFLRKWLQDARDSQRENGAYTDVVPFSRVVGWGAAAWGDAGIIVPYVLYRMYGDKTVIEECYESMTKYMKYIESIGLSGPLPRYGDWLAYDPTTPEFISVAYYAYDALLMAKMSEVIGKKDEADEYQKLYERIKEYFAENFTENGQPKEKTQTSYLLCLKLKLLTPENLKIAAKELVKKIKENGYKLSTGFVGSGTICQTLSEVGESNTAYSLLLQTENPSWIYSIRQGATTIWERWDSYTKERGFGNVGMNSFNHYAYGAVGEWMYRYMAGIDTDEQDTGFKHIILKPMPDTRTPDEMPEGQERITYVKASFNSPVGNIYSAWEFANESFTYSVSIPENTTATLYFPLVINATEIEINGKKHSVKDENVVDDYVKFELGGGDYTLSI